MWFNAITIVNDADIVDSVNDFFETQGALAISLDDANDEPLVEPSPGATPLWSSVKITALFDDAEHANRVVLLHRQQFPLLKCTLESFADCNWETISHQDLRPLQFGERLWVCPSWIEPPEPHACVITLDPGLACGTGTHPTTELCLRWLESQPIDNKTIIDFGCGSGILSIAALKLGAQHVTAIDIDEQALIATRDNAERNGISSHQYTLSDTAANTAKSSIIIANILAKPLHELRDIFLSCLTDTGDIVVSGVLIEQMDALIECYSPLLRVIDTFIKDEWACIWFSR